MRVDLQGQTAIVTGASKGIGYAIAADLASAGANVVLCSRNEADLTRAVDELKERGLGRIVAVACDMRRYEDVKRLVERTIDTFDRIDILINNAGVGAFAPIDEITPDTWHEVVETNLNGAYYASYEAIPHMTRQGGGWIINIGSLAGKNPFAGGAAYNASKFGLLGFSEAMMLDVRHRGIRVSCIMPGSVETHFSHPHSQSPPGSADWKLQPADISEMVMDLVAFPSRALPSRIEMRPSQPPKKG